MWPYTQEENEFLSESKESEDSQEWDYDTYGHGA